MASRVLVAAAVVLALFACSPENDRSEKVPKVADFRIGVLDGAPEETFGRIDDIEVDDRGRLYILDYLNRDIRIFGPTGLHLQTVGREGSGPGEYQEPRALLIGNHNRLYALDAANFRITVYEIGDSLRYVGDNRIHVSGIDFCQIDDRLFILGAARELMLHEYRVSDGALWYEKSFAYPTVEGHVMRTSQTMGHLVCLAEERLVVFTSRLWPLVRAFSMDGEEVWRYEIPDYRQIVITQELKGRVTFSLPEEEPRFYHVATAAFAVQSNRVAVQIEVEGLLGSYFGATTRFELRILEIGTGETARVPLPHRLLSVTKDHVYGVEEEPFPQVIVGPNSH